MHPALSVILFSTLSGAGYGLLFWLGLLVAFGQAGRAPSLILTSLAIAFVLVSAGLLASLAHLGRPERAWRAMSQWRSSWLSREGVAAIVSYVPMLVLAAATGFGWPRTWQMVAALAGCAMAIVTVLCTARIYDTLQPIPAWRNGWVLPNYFALAAVSGAAWLWAIGVLGFALPAHRGDGAILIVLLLIAGALKLAYWRHIDRRAATLTAGSAIGLGADVRVTPFEAPHSEANFLLKEMGFALARKHAQRLRRIVVLLLVAVPAIVLSIAIAQPQARPFAAAATLLCVTVSLLAERWLFFAQARHVVVTYYDARAT